MRASPWAVPVVALLLLALTLSGCATEGVAMHRMPPETPAANNAAAIKKAQALAAAAADLRSLGAAQSFQLSIQCTVR